ncbi:HMG-box domain-containing protein [Alkalihalobacterium elongatum]|uniref:hypothetical protein n=1 Tax=Alkalihalobacterium elongatum TaxID=2675466 RepID=UPI001C1F9B74|nr:hypothetical protein [Alkalihalobacterium elongatum]
MRFQKITGGIIALLVLTLLILSYQYYVGVKENDQQWKTFVNHFYFAIDNSIFAIDHLLENEYTSKNLEGKVRKLEKELLRADAIISHGNSFMNNDLYRSNFFLEATYFLYGINMTGTITVELPPMGENGVLEERDITLLRTIRGYLESAKQGLYSEQTKQENPNLTIDEVNKIIWTHLNKDSYQIYKDAF